MGVRKSSMRTTVTVDKMEHKEFRDLLERMHMTMGEFFREVAKGFCSRARRAGAQSNGELRAVLRGMIETYDG